MPRNGLCWSQASTIKEPEIIETSHYKNPDHLALFSQIIYNSSFNTIIDQEAHDTVYEYLRRINEAFPTASQYYQIDQSAPPKANLSPQIVRPARLCYRTPNAITTSDRLIIPYEI
jgi:hypothetical protein